MGNTNGIELVEKKYGILDVKVEGNPNYPIAYLRLCWDLESKKYCIAEDCDVENKFGSHRKLIVVGMNLPGYKKIHEQCFYLSSGLNAVESMEKFFEQPLIKNKDSLDFGVWIPFSGFGYPFISKLNEKILDKEDDIKLLKANFDCTTRGKNCLFGRFGNSEPNLMQISYCLGGQFWIDNLDLINSFGFKIEKMPMLDDIFRKQKICNFKYKGLSNVVCSIYLNDYIASASPYNYSPLLLAVRDKFLRFFKPNKDFKFEDVKFDYRILNILIDHKYIEIDRYDNMILLPTEVTLSVDFFKTYLIGVDNMYKKNISFFLEKVLPIINQNIPLIPMDRKSHTIEKEDTKEDLNFVIEKKQIKKEKIVKEDLNFVIAKKKDNKENIVKEVARDEIKEEEAVPVAGDVIGTQENPHPKRGDAQIGEYYKTKGGVFKRNK